ncbi:hypothetical protein [Okibacterium fritillariae]|uniref:Uncharacterized protein n=1 Tax=Okibacterium fritillariae TaxID=123320 RepID=A0A1T5KXM1_9MICO|nr:hypothetical protein [Okibacterium fritillariae]SKC68431.1 hypothetical protein SAMN06309945_2629 [Okibacterium fritillariae]
MAVTQAHEGVFRHPTYPGLYVVDPAQAHSAARAELSLEALRQAAAARKSSRRVRTIVIFVITLVVVFAILSAIGYNTFSSIFIAIGAGIVVDSILLPLLYRPGQTVPADDVIESGAALSLQSLDSYGVPVVDSTPWSTLWQLASAYAIVDDEEAALDDLEYWKWQADTASGAGNASVPRGAASRSEGDDESGSEPVTEADVDRQRLRRDLALAEADSLATRLGYPPAPRTPGHPHPLTETRPGDDLV